MEETLIMMTVTSIGDKKLRAGPRSALEPIGFVSLHQCKREWVLWR